MESVAGGVESTRNSLTHIYSEDEADELILLIRDSFIPALFTLERTLKEKLDEAGDDWA